MVAAQGGGPAASTAGIARLQHAARMAPERAAPHPPHGCVPQGGAVSDSQQGGAFDISKLKGKGVKGKGGPATRGSAPAPVDSKKADASKKKVGSASSRSTLPCVAPCL